MADEWRYRHLMIQCLPTNYFQPIAKWKLQQEF